MYNLIHAPLQFYIDRGNKAGVPIIFIHGFPFDHSTWDEQVKIIPSRFRPIAYDIHGHGQSEAGDGPFSIEFFVDDLFSLIEYLDLEQCVLCGLSMGGYIALRAIERKPDLFNGLILCDTRSEPDINETKINRAASIKLIREQGIKKYADESVKNLFWTENIRKNIPAIALIKSIIEKMSSEAISYTLMALAARTDTTESLEQIRIPTLIIVGEYDKITPPIVAEALHENITGSDLVVIKDAGHLSNLDNPEEFNIALLEFLEKVK